jgi:hypothetical protein
MLKTVNTSKPEKWKIGYQLDNQDTIPGRGWNFSLCCQFRPAMGIPPPSQASYTMGTGGSFRRSNVA